MKTLAQLRGDRCLKESFVISQPNVKGAHDAQFVVHNGMAYVVYEANDVRPGEAPTWPEIYCVMNIVDLATKTVVKTVKISENGQKFNNRSLPFGCTFVPRIIKLNENFLRIFFTSENPGVRDSECFFIDFDLYQQEFVPEIYPLMLKTSLGTFPFTPKALFDSAIANGHEARDVHPVFFNCSTFLFDIFNVDETPYLAINAFWSGINALAKFNETFDCVEVIGHIGEHNDEHSTTESGIAKKTDGTWFCILREEKHKNCMFSESADGINWSSPHYDPLIKDGINSKPILRKFNGTFYLGYNKENGRDRSRFVILRSIDAEVWEEYADIESETTFQYPTLELIDGKILFVATIGNKEKIIMGTLE